MFCKVLSVVLILLGYKYNFALISHDLRVLYIDLVRLIEGGFIYAAMESHYLSWVKTLGSLSLLWATSHPCSVSKPKKL